MSPDVHPPLIERYGYTPDGLYYGPPYPGDDETLADLEADGWLGHSSTRRGDDRYFLRYPAPRPERFGWGPGDITITSPGETEQEGEP